MLLTLSKNFSSCCGHIYINIYIEIRLSSQTYVIEGEKKNVDFHLNEAHQKKNMVKQNSSTNFNRHANQYPSSHNKPMNSARYRSNRVEVTQTKGGCCGSRKVASVPSQPIIVQSARKAPPPPPPEQQTAHQRTHLRLDPPDPFYTRYRRMRKTPQGTPRNYQSDYGTKPMNSTRSTGEPQLTNRSRNYQAPSVRQQQQPPPPPLRAPPTTTTTNKSCCCTIL